MLIITCNSRLGIHCTHQLLAGLPESLQTTLRCTCVLHVYISPCLGTAGPSTLSHAVLNSYHHINVPTQCCITSAVRQAIQPLLHDPSCMYEVSQLLHVCMLLLCFIFWISVIDCFMTSQFSAIVASITSLCLFPFTERYF